MKSERRVSPAEDRLECILQFAFDIIDDHFVVQGDFHERIGLARSIPGAIDQRFDQIQSTFQRNRILVEIELQHLLMSGIDCRSHRIHLRVEDRRIDRHATHLIRRDIGQFANSKFTLERKRVSRLNQVSTELHLEFGVDAFLVPDFVRPARTFAFVSEGERHATEVMGEILQREGVQTIIEVLVVFLLFQFSFHNLGEKSNSSPIERR